MPGQWPELVEEVREKKPDEVLPLGIDFNPRLAAGDVFSGVAPDVTCVKEWGAGGELVIQTQQWQGGIWAGLFEVGSAPSDHRLEVYVDTVGGHTLGHIVVIEIRA